MNAHTVINHVFYDKLKKKKTYIRPIHKHEKKDNSPKRRKAYLSQKYDSESMKDIMDSPFEGDLVLARVPLPGLLQDLGLGEWVRVRDLVLDLYGLYLSLGLLDLSLGLLDLGLPMFRSNGERFRRGLRE